MSLSNAQLQELLLARGVVQPAPVVPTTIPSSFFSVKQFRAQGGIIALIIFSVFAIVATAIALRNLPTTVPKIVHDWTLALFIISILFLVGALVGWYLDYQKFQRNLLTERLLATYLPSTTTTTL